MRIRKPADCDSEDDCVRMFLSTSAVPAVIYFTVLLSVPVNGLVCYRCFPHENDCLDVTVLHSTQNCQKDEVCYKINMYPKGSIRSLGPGDGQESDKVFRGCRHQNLSSENDGCEYIEFKPYDSWLCVCSDKNYCNGVANFRSVNIFVGLHQLVLYLLVFIRCLLPDLLHI